MSWTGLLIVTALCAAAKQAGAAVPRRWLTIGGLDRLAPLLPVALLSSLIAIATFGRDRVWVFDERAVALAVAGLATWRRAPFPLVVALAAGTAALIRSV